MEVIQKTEKNFNRLEIKKSQINSLVPLFEFKNSKGVKEKYFKH